MSVSRRYNVGILSVFFAVVAGVDVAFGGGWREMLCGAQRGFRDGKGWCGCSWVVVLSVQHMFAHARRGHTTSVRREVPAQGRDGCGVNRGLARSLPTTCPPRA